MRSTLAYLLKECELTAEEIDLHWIKDSRAWEADLVVLHKHFLGAGLTPGLALLQARNHAEAVLNRLAMRRIA